MNKSRILGAVDIGSIKIATIIAQVSLDPATFETSVNILGAASSPSRGVKKGQIVDIEEAVEATITSVEAAERMAGYNLGSALVGVGGAHIQSQNSTGVVAVSDPEGEVTPADVERVVVAARAISLPTSREVIHVLPRGFIVDGESQVKDPVGMSAVRLEVETHLITSSSAALKNLTKTVREVGIDIEGMVFNGVASSESVLTPTEKELGCVLVDIGGGTTSIAAFVDGTITYCGAIPIGGRNVTNDLAIGLRLPLEIAEKVKFVLSREPKNKEEDQLDLSRYGAPDAKRVSRRTLTEGIVRPRLNEIFTMVKIELERVGVLGRTPSGIIVTGGASETIGLEESAKKILSLPVRLGSPTGVGGLTDDVLTPSFACAVGLILHGAKMVQAPAQPSLGKRFKLPSKGILGKVFESVRDLLP